MKFKALQRASALVVAALVASILSASAASADVGNGTFDDGVDPWWSYGTTALEAVEGRLRRVYPCSGVDKDR